MRRSLAVLVAATTSLVLIAFLVPIGVLLRSESAERATTAATLRAQSTADQLAALTEASLDPHGDTTVFLADGRTIGVPAVRSDSVELARRGQTFVAETEGGREVLVAVQSVSSGTAVVRVFVPESQLYAGVLRTWTLLALLGLVLAGLGLLLADQLGRRLVRPVTELASAAERLGRGESAARVSPAGPPEIRAAGAELNRLADRIDELLTATRAEAADLAHRLRTPLTALRLDIGGLRDPAEAARLGDSLHSLSTEVDELIRTSRRPDRTGVVARADLAAVARDRLAFWMALAEDTGRPLSGRIPDEPVLVRLAAGDLAAALDVLLDNAFRHTPDEAEVLVTVDPAGTLSVEDAGSGFAAAVAERPGTTGLGLDIARRSAEAAGGTLRIDRSDLGGAMVVLSTRLTGPRVGA